ncbi:hypothetical protein [Micromonospora krabiensis]|uniref:Uncharacterized protein n=1 Tax=Micromonospora krabiensis TaxID=307121 RepID=A0A1C3N4L8_9ACTN|nr:hypothetical protein [Micromonospora krabiensis]SBV27530.1 hypothetical protein GA0070620_3054 [Micromonospora krabiensis]
MSPFDLGDMPPSPPASARSPPAAGPAARRHTRRPWHPRTYDQQLAAMDTDEFVAELRRGCAEVFEVVARARQARGEA